MDRLNRIQYAALRICLGALKSTPTNSLLAEAAEAPLEIRRQVITNRFLIKKFNYDHAWIHNCLEPLAVLHFENRFWYKKPIPPLIAGFHTLKPLEEEMMVNNRLTYFTMSWKGTLPKKYIHLSDDFDNEKKIDKKLINLKLNNLMHSRWKNFIQIYTDGSKTDNGVGCAVWIPSQNKQLQIKMPDWATIFTAEVMAINRALDLIRKHKLEKVIILSDSKSALHALNIPKYFGNPLIFDSIRKIEDLIKKKHNIELIWIRGHANIIGNEIADGLAKDAHSTPSIVNKIPAVDLKGIVTKNGMSQWQKVFDQDSRLKGRLYQPCNPKVILKIKVIRHYETDVSGQLKGKASWSACICVSELHNGGLSPDT
ncbi:uncharacterized protein LOC113385987 [Ctenocephalides felis]|uniref:uncharacterized protein LOC113385987 n=1 Tax=Ctenocephalides felis TaxID=7515 RepID=UPI000E6E3013|nr:uncharacterized protein LOC113385987 [Ctenocephalides felis]